MLFWIMAEALAHSAAVSVCIKGASREANEQDKTSTHQKSGSKTRPALTKR